MQSLKRLSDIEWRSLGRVPCQCLSRNQLKLEWLLQTGWLDWEDDPAFLEDGIGIVFVKACWYQEGYNTSDLAQQKRVQSGVEV